jgi:5-methylcytosine-specific restriction endonuclease McrA
MISALEEPTLVLNRHWTAVNVVSVRRAIVLVCRDAARIIAPDTFEIHDLGSWLRQRIKSSEPVIRLVQSAIRVPEVIVLRHSDRAAVAHVPFTRRNLYRRDQNTCQYCGKRPGTERLSIDHIVPKSAGGVTSWLNCVLACLSCNLRKSNKTLEDAGMSLLRSPTRPKWVPYEVVPRGLSRESWPKFISQSPSELESRSALGHRCDNDAAFEGYGT